MADFTLNRTWPIFHDYIPVYKIWIQYTNLFKRWKRAITPTIMGGFYPKWNLTSVLWLYTLCIKYESNTLMFSKDIIISNRNYFSTLKKGRNSKNNWWILPLIELDLYFIIIYLCIKYESNTLIFSKVIEQKPFFKVEKGPITPKIIDGFYPKSNLTYILWLYTCV